MFSVQTGILTATGDFGVQLKLAQDKYSKSNSINGTDVGYFKNGTQDTANNGTFNDGSSYLKKQKHFFEIADNYFVTDNIAIASNLALPKKSDLRIYSTDNNKWVTEGSIKNTNLQ